MKRLLTGFLLIGFCGTVFAQLTTNALQFAQQAGIVGGAAQACSQDITTYNSRVVEAINTLGINAGDRQSAMIVYQKAVSEVLYTQTRLHNLNCGQVMQQFASLPIMRPDYETTVIPALAQMNNGSTTSTTGTSSATTTNPAAPTTPNTTVPNTTPVSTTPSAPDTSSAPNTPAALDTTPDATSATQPEEANPVAITQPSPNAVSTQAYVTGNGE